MGAGGWLSECAATAVGVDLESRLAEWDHPPLAGTDSVALHYGVVSIRADSIAVSVAYAPVVVKYCVPWT